MIPCPQKPIYRAKEQLLMIPIISRDMLYPAFWRPSWIYKKVKRVWSVHPLDSVIRRQGLTKKCKETVVGKHWKVLGKYGVWPPKIAELICIKRVCETFFQLEAIASLFLHFVPNLENVIRSIFMGRCK